MDESEKSNEVIDPKTDPKRKAKSNDPGWQYGFWPDLAHKELIECTLCGKQVRQGINRLKQHLAANYADVSRCPKTTTEIMRVMREALLSKRKKKSIRLDDFDEENEDEVEEVSGKNTQSTNSTAASAFVASSGTAAKKKRAATLYDFAKADCPPPKQQKTVVSMLRKTPEEVVYERHQKGSKQMTLDAIGVMELAKKTIRESFEHNASLCKFVIDTIDKRWETQMGVQLYAAALFLNPGKFFDIQEQDYRNACKLREDFNDVIEKMVPDIQTRDLVSTQTDNYEHRRENFARQMAIDQSKTKSPLDWWSAFGGRAPDLAMIAKRIVGLCCSSSGCERNWSTFEFIHTKKRNRLEHKRLNDLVYIQYNEKIAERFQKRSELGEKFDPIALEDFNWSGEWVGNPDADVVHPGEDLLWDQVAIAAGPARAVRHLRIRDQGGETNSRQPLTYNRRNKASSSHERSRFRLHDSESEEENDGILPDIEDDEDIDDDYGEIPSSHQSKRGEEDSI